jgi:chaperone modulatory protein CbpM
MAHTHLTVIDAVVVEQDLRFTLADLCRACAADPSTIIALVEEGLLQPDGTGPANWQFDGRALPRARTAVRLAADLRLSVEATVLAVELLDEIQTLRARLRRAGLA